MRITRQNLRPHYLDLWSSAYIEDDKRPLVEWYIKRITPNADRYRRIADEVRVPWWIIAVVHSLEASLDFSKNIQNGQPLNQITTIVPKGLKPFDTWEDSVRYEFLVNRKKDTKGYKWDLPDAFYFLESHNGFGYFHRRINTPYIWSFTNHYVTGLFVKDSTFNGSKVSNNAGAAAILLGLVEKDLITYEELFEPDLVKPSKPDVIITEPTRPIDQSKPIEETNKPNKGESKMSEFFKKVIEFLISLFKRKERK